MDTLLLRLKEYHLGTYQHSIRVSQLCFQLAKDLGFSKEECQLAGSAGLYHDVGKLTIPLDILAKPGKLTKEEYTTIQGHVLSGVDLLKDRGVDSPVIEAVLHHHEREDGTGYPGGIRTISPLGRIIAICDVFDALTENREYRMGSTKETAVKQIITKQVGSFYMPYVHQFNLLIKNEIKSRKSINFPLQMQEL